MGLKTLQTDINVIPTALAKKIATSTTSREPRISSKSPYLFDQGMDLRKVASGVYEFNGRIFPNVRGNNFGGENP